MCTFNINFKNKGKKGKFKCTRVIWFICLTFLHWANFMSLGLTCHHICSLSHVTVFQAFRLMQFSSCSLDCTTLALVTTKSNVMLLGNVCIPSAPTCWPQWSHFLISCDARLVPQNQWCYLCCDRCTIVFPDLFDKCPEFCVSVSVITAVSADYKCWCGCSMWVHLWGA